MYQRNPYDTVVWVNWRIEVYNQGVRIEVTEANAHLTSRLGEERDKMSGAILTPPFLSKYATISLLLTLFSPTTTKLIVGTLESPACSLPTTLIPLLREPAFVK